MGGVVTLGTLAGCQGSAEEDARTTDSGTPDGVVTVEASEDSVDAAFERLKRAVENADGLSTVAELDHSANAARVDMDLPATRVLFFGNPAAGTPLMQSSQRAGLDLPQRMLVWEDGDIVKISYNDPEYVADRHGIGGHDELLQNIAAALDTLATEEP